MNKTIGSLLLAGLAATFAVSAVATAQDNPGTGTATKERKRDDAKKDTPKDESRGKATVGQPAPNFTLKTTDGKDWSLSDAKGKIVVLEWCNPECPVCKNVVTDGTVSAMIKDTKAVASDVVFVMINSSAARPSSLDATGAYFKDAKIDAPALLDRDGKVGKMYGARTTPHCYVIDDKGVLRYQGAIDDGGQGKKGTMNYVVNAVKQIKAGETVSPETTKPYGCSVKY